MKFGKVSLDQAVGGILAHSIRLPDDTVLRKGLILEPELIDLMHAASMEEVVVALPEPDDTLEDEAARRIADCIVGKGLRLDVAKTGRVNLFATENGLFRVSAELINQLNDIDPGITVATLPDYSEVNDGRMVATVKIIPYGVATCCVEQVEAMGSMPKLHLAPFAAKRIGLVSSLLPGTKPTVLDKTRKNLEKRLALSGSEVAFEERVFHLDEDLQKAIGSRIDECDILVIFGASAISDIRDVVPSAIVAAGGSIIRFGMPVDPGNLILLAEINGKPVLGAPGCARSPAENGFDWVLQRLLANVPVSSAEIAGFGVGGLLMETGARPHPREKKSGRAKFAALVLAAGQSRRMGEVNKLTAKVHGKAMVRHVVQAASDSSCDEVHVVLGHQSGEVKEALDGVDCGFVLNPSFEEGLSTSLVAGITALGADVTHVVVLLGDMPMITAEHINRLIARSRENADQIVMATANGKRGNPVLWPSRFFDELKNVVGDVGARHIIGANADRVTEIELGEAAGLDIDTPTTLQVIAASPDS